jgi:hypothetical protein
MAMSEDARLDPKRIARILGAEHRGKVSARGGYFGAMQLAAEVRDRFRVPEGGGRATDPSWTETRQVRFTSETLEQLGHLAEKLSRGHGISISSLQLAALLVERATQSIDEASIGRLARQLGARKSG